MQRVVSEDGTQIAVERVGTGAPLVIVGGALSTRASNSLLVEVLADKFSVLSYDRRGRGDSGDTDEYAVEHEVADLAAVVSLAGDAVSVFGSSSGGNLALRAAGAGLQIDRLALWEPNFLADASRPALPADYVDHLNALVAEGRRGDAVEYFMTAAVGVPAEFVSPMREMPFFAGMEAVAHTLAYDGRVVGAAMAGRPPAPDDFAAVRIPTLILDGGTTPWLSAGADALAAALPDAKRRTLHGQPHDVDALALAPALRDYFSG
jgi:alpha-beta hydrolase superfamily lysophospholipase